MCTNTDEAKTATNMYMCRYLNTCSSLFFFRIWTNQLHLINVTRFEQKSKSNVQPGKKNTDLLFWCSSQNMLKHVKGRKAFSSVLTSHMIENANFWGKKKRKEKLTDNISFPENTQNLHLRMYMTDKGFMSKEIHFISKKIHVKN